MISITKLMYLMDTKGKSYKEIPSFPVVFFHLPQRSWEFCQKIEENRNASHPAVLIAGLKKHEIKTPF